MSDEFVTTTVFSTTTVTTTRLLTRTILSIISTTASTTGIHPDTENTGSERSGSSMSSLYDYSPSLPLSIIFIVLYFIITLHHGYLSLYLPTRPETLDKHRYTIPLFLASLFSTLGYLSRSISIQRSHASNLPLYTISTALILISPVFVCATLYLLLTRLITRCLPTTTTFTPATPRLGAMTVARTNHQTFFLLSPKLLSVMFITSNVVSLTTQCLGAAIAASNNWLEPELSRGVHILLAGLALQLATFLLFTLTQHLFCRRVRNSATAGFNPCIMRVVVGVWIASGFVLVRTAFRLVDFSMGSNGYAYRHEWCLYVFEALPVWVALAVLAWWHPVKWIQERLLGAEAPMLTVSKTGGRGGGARATEHGMIAISNPSGATNDGPGRKSEGPVRRRSWTASAQ